MSTRYEMSEQEMRTIRVWEKRVLRPKAADTSLLELKTEMQTAHRRFLDTLERLPEERMNTPLGEERMTGAELLAHLAVVMRWQTEKLREVETGEPAQDAVFAAFFAGTQGRSLAALRADFDDAWHALEKAVAGCSEETPGSALHPWFEALNVKEWIASISAHFAYHRKQVETSDLLSL
jgi:hypothetical protein